MDEAVDDFAEPKKQRKELDKCEEEKFKLIWKKFFVQSEFQEKDAILIF